MKALLLAVLIGFFSLVSYAQPLGTNSGFAQDWSQEWPLADVSKLTREWSITSGSASFDSRGYPTSVNGKITTYFGWDRGQYLPAGTYVLTWDGIADLTVLPQPGFNINYVNDNRIEVTVDPSQNPNGFLLDLTFVDGFDNFHFWMPGHEGTDKLLNNFFVHSLRAHAGGYRTMNMQETNGSNITNVDSLPLMSDWSWNRDGYPLEAIGMVIAELPSDAYINIGAKFSDLVIEIFAAIIADNVKPNQKVYIEYSNETWNSGFSQHRWIGDNYGFGDSVWSRAWVGTGIRATQVMDIVEDYIPAENLIRVLAGQAANDYVLEQSLANSDPSKFDAIAIAPYYSHIYASSDPVFWSEQSLDQWFTAARDEFNKLDGWIQDHVNLANEYGYQVIAYEGGSHVAPVTGAQKDNGSFVQKTIDFHRDSRIAILQRDYLDLWYSKTDGVMFLFEHIEYFDKHGSWGHLEYLEQPYKQSPKMLGNVLFLIDYNRDGILDNGDVSAFVFLFLSEDIKADLNNDAVIDNGDITRFLDLFLN